ncbi:MAG: M48 family metallopeptidase [Bacteroidales bacterium]|nr:M48 family metallopeptidase [Bacteroidales bacterium]
MQKLVFVKDVGEVKIQKKYGIKNLRLSIHPKNGINISMPPHVSYDKAIEFLKSKQNWLTKKAAKFKHLNDKDFIITNAYEFIGIKFNIKFYKQNKYTADYKNDVIEVFIPEFEDINSEQSQAFLRKAAEMALKNKAHNYIPERVKFLAKQNNFTFNSLKIGSSKTRWGSCSSSNNLIFSCYLMLMPKELIDFIIIHELCHTVHKNHGKEFHSLVDRICNGREKELTAKLKAQIHPLMYN